MNKKYVRQSVFLFSVRLCIAISISVWVHLFFCLSVGVRLFVSLSVFVCPLTCIAYRLYAGFRRSAAQATVRPSVSVRPCVGPCPSTRLNRIPHYLSLPRFLPKLHFRIIILRMIYFSSFLTWSRIVICVSIVVMNLHSVFQYINFHFIT